MTIAPDTFTQELLDAARLQLPEAEYELLWFFSRDDRLLFLTEVLYRVRGKSLVLSNAQFRRLRAVLDTAPTEGP